MNTQCRRKRIGVLLAGGLLLLGTGLLLRHFMQMPGPVAAGIQLMKGKKTMEERVAEFGPAVRARLAPAFARVGVGYPPKRVTLVGLKWERKLELWVAESEGPWKLVKTYPILGLSGRLGPKLREGDRQVPEGVYRVESLNPNSLYHLALRVGYPNPADLERAARDGRTNPGSDIMIHGKDCSIGCLAMGDEAAEELFVLAAETGIENVSVVLSPVDFRVRELPEGLADLPAWSGELYAEIRAQLDCTKD